MQIVLLFLNLVLFTFSAIVLIQSSIHIIIRLEHLSRDLRLSTFLTGFFFLAVATSIPELFIGITSALQNTPEISLGNIIGSNLANITIIIGIAILVAGKLNVDKRYQKEILITTAISTIFVLLSLDGLLSRTDGIILITTFVIYTYRLIKIRRYEKDEIIDIKVDRNKVLNSIFIVSILIALMLISSTGIVSSTTKLAVLINISPLIISLFIIAIGTSLPELASMIPAIRKEHTGISLGNILGSVITNSTLVIGITALLSPIIIKPYFEYRFSIIFTLFGFLMFYIFTRGKSNLSKKDAILLIFVYIIFLFIQIFLKNSL